MNKEKLINIIKTKKNFLCVGIDPDMDKMPVGIERNVYGVKLFCEKIIHATLPYCMSYKFNLAFFECFGWEGIKIFQELVAMIPDTHFIIADAKRGDIGNTSKKYAEAYFNTFQCDAITINPYMGEDSVTPFLGFKDKWAIVLGLTSNKGSQDIELMPSGDSQVYLNTMTKCASWGKATEMMFVIGATQSEEMKKIRTLFPHYFFLVPGVGAQGGSLDEVCENLLTDEIGILINSSREILYASQEEDFQVHSAEKAREMAEKMALYF